jgi:hypothetical protein
MIMDLLKKIEIFIGEEVKFSKFDDVLIKSKNKAGMIYKMSGKSVVIKTASGLIKTTIDDIRLMSEGASDGKSFPFKKKESDKNSDEKAQDADNKLKDMESDTDGDEGEDPYDPATDLDQEKKQKELKKKAGNTSYTPVHKLP